MDGSTEARFIHMSHRAAAPLGSGGRTSGILATSLRASVPSSSTALIHERQRKRRAARPARSLDACASCAKRCDTTARAGACPQGSSSVIGTVAVAGCATSPPSADPARECGSRRSCGKDLSTSQSMQRPSERTFSPPARSPNRAHERCAQFVHRGRRAHIPGRNAWCARVGEFHARTCPQDIRMLAAALFANPPAKRLSTSRSAMRICPQPQ